MGRVCVSFIFRCRLREISGGELRGTSEKTFSLRIGGGKEGRKKAERKLYMEMDDDEENFKLPWRESKRNGVCVWGCGRGMFMKI